MSNMKYARFGNHTDPLTDYHVEVSLINSLVNDHLRHGLHDRTRLLERIDKAWLNVVQPEWVTIKNRLREVDAAMRPPPRPLRTIRESNADETK